MGDTRREACLIQMCQEKSPPRHGFTGPAAAGLSLEFCVHHSRQDEECNF